MAAAQGRAYKAEPGTSLAFPRVYRLKCLLPIHHWGRLGLQLKDKKSSKTPDPLDTKEFLPDQNVALETHH